MHVWDRPFFVTTAHTDGRAGVGRARLRREPGRHARSRLLRRAVPGGPGGDGSPCADVVPFTDPQMEVWLGTQISAGGQWPRSTRSWASRFAAARPGALQGAVDDVIGRHESLRMTVSSSRPGSWLAPAMPVTVEMHDLTGRRRSRGAPGRHLRRFNSEPMDLARGPLWRVGVLRERDARRRGRGAIHHLICDGWSFGVLCATSRRVTRPGATRRRARVAAGDAGRRVCSRPRSRALRRRRGQRHRRLLARPVPGPCRRRWSFRPIGRGRSCQRVPGRRLVVTFDGRPGAARAAVRLHAAHDGVLHAARRVRGADLPLTGQTDFVVGVPMAGQALIERHDLIAHCVNFVAMRCAIDPAATFEAHLAAVTRQALDLSDHQEHTYLTLAECVASAANDWARPARLGQLHPGARRGGADVRRNAVDVLDRAAHDVAARSARECRSRAPAGLTVEVDYNSALFDELRCAPGWRVPHLPGVGDRRPGAATGRIAPGVHGRVQLLTAPPAPAPRRCGSIRRCRWRSSSRRRPPARPTRWRSPARARPDLCGAQRPGQPHRVAAAREGRGRPRRAGWRVSSSAGHGSCRRCSGC